MKRNFLLSGVLALVLSFALVPGLAAQDGTYEGEYTGGGGGGGVDLGLQASTNFQDMLVGLKVQFANFAIIPKMGFIAQPLKDSAGTIFLFEFGCGFDYYFPKWATGKLRPYLGNDLIFTIVDLGKATDTKFWVIDDIHIGAEYWITDRFSIGGNVGLNMGFGESPYSPNTIGLIIAESSFGFGIGGKLNMTYYF